MEIKNGRRFGVGSIPFEEVCQSSNTQLYEENYRVTQEKHVQIQKDHSKKIKDFDRILKDVAFWNSKMSQLYPNLVPPSCRNQADATNPANV